MKKGLVLLLFFLSAGCSLRLIGTGSSVSGGNKTFFQRPSTYYYMGGSLVVGCIGGFIVWKLYYSSKKKTMFHQTQGTELLKKMCRKMGIGIKSEIYSLENLLSIKDEKTCSRCIKEIMSYEYYYEKSKNVLTIFYIETITSKKVKRIYTIEGNTASGKPFNFKKLLTKNIFVRNKDGKNNKNKDEKKGRGSTTTFCGIDRIIEYPSYQQALKSTLEIVRIKRCFADNFFEENLAEKLKNTGKVLEIEYNKQQSIDLGGN